MMHAAGDQGPAQGRRHMVLPHHIREGSRPVRTVEGQRHPDSVSPTCCTGGPASAVAYLRGLNSAVSSGTRTSAKGQVSGMTSRSHQPREKAMAAAMSSLAHAGSGSA